MLLSFTLILTLKITLLRFIPPQQQIEGYEQLLRRLLRLPHQPAIVVVHWWSPVHDCSDSQQVSPGPDPVSAMLFPITCLHCTACQLTIVHTDVQHVCAIAVVLMVQSEASVAVSEHYTCAAMLRQLELKNLYPQGVGASV